MRLGHEAAVGEEQAPLTAAITQARAHLACRMHHVIANRRAREGEAATHAQRHVGPGRQHTPRIFRHARKAAVDLQQITVLGGDGVAGQRFLQRRLHTGRMVIIFSLADVVRLGGLRRSAEKYHARLADAHAPRRTMAGNDHRCTLVDAVVCHHERVVREAQLPVAGARLQDFLRTVRAANPGVLIGGGNARELRPQLRTLLLRLRKSLPPVRAHRVFEQRVEFDRRDQAVRPAVLAGQGFQRRLHHLGRPAGAGQGDRAPLVGPARFRASDRADLCLAAGNALHGASQQHQRRRSVPDHEPRKGAQTRQCIRQRLRDPLHGRRKHAHQLQRIEAIHRAPTGIGARAAQRLQHQRTRIRRLRKVLGPVVDLAHADDHGQSIPCIHARTSKKVLLNDASSE